MKKFFSIFSRFTFDDGTRPLDHVTIYLIADFYYSDSTNSMIKKTKTQPAKFPVSVKIIIFVCAYNLLSLNELLIVFLIIHSPPRIFRSDIKSLVPF